jgi:LacI family transcriptional regulator
LRRSEAPTNDGPTAERRPTLRDVAREAGLSVTQTSRALNGHADVAEATRQRAVDAAGRMGYTPNLEARRLKMPDTKRHSIGLILDTASQRFSDPFFGELLTELVDEAAVFGYELQLSAPLADEDPVDSYERAIRAKRVDGFVVLRTTHGDPRIPHLARSGVPFVSFGEPDHSDGHRTVSDSVDCLRPAIDHLVALGHRRIGCVAEPLTFTVATTRHASFLRALGSHGIDPNPDYLTIEGFREEAGYRAALRLLDLDDPPTALVTFNDLLAIGALGAAHSRGVLVPSHLSIIGFDDIHAARHTSPPLTTLRQSATSIGRSLIRQLVRAIAEPHRPAEHVHLTPELVVRRSTASAPS